MSDQTHPVLKVPQLGVVVADHCCFTCFGCNAYSPSLPTRNYKPEDYAQHLYALQAFMRTRQAVLVGGEPMLNPWLLDVAATVRRSQVADLIRVFTNGFWLRGDWRRFIPALSAIDWLTISIHPELFKYKGGFTLPRLDDVLGEIATQLPNLRIDRWQLGFFFIPLFGRQPRERPDQCNQRYCLRLGSEGYLYRCPQVQAAKHAATVTPEFLAEAERDVLTIEGTDFETFKHWYLDAPPHACKYCLYGYEKYTPLIDLDLVSDQSVIVSAGSVPRDEPFT